MSAKIYRFPRSYRRRPVPLPAPARYTIRPYSRHDAGFGLLLMVTLLAAFCYLTGVVKVARHDALYAAVLVTVWGFYFFYPPLLRTCIGPFLIGAARLLLLAGIAGFFGGIYWLILRSG